MLEQTLKDEFEAVSVSDNMAQNDIKTAGDRALAKKPMGKQARFDRRQAIVRKGTGDKADTFNTLDPEALDAFTVGGMCDEEDGTGWDEQVRVVKTLGFRHQEDIKRVNITRDEQTSM